jgi:hypothetical protein
VTSDELTKRACALLEASVHNGTPRLAPTTCVRLVATIESVADTPWVEAIKQRAKANAEQALRELEAAVARDEALRVKAETEATREQARIVGAAFHKPQ